MALPLDGLLRAVKQAEVPVLFHQEVDEAFLRKVRPEVLVWAVGGEALRPPLEGADEVPVFTSQEYYLEGREIPGEHVLVLGGGLVGVEAAEKLAIEGHRVTVVELLSDLAAGMENVGRALLFNRLKSLPNVTLHTSTRVRAVGKEALVLESPDGVRTLAPVDAVLLAAGMRPRPVPESFKAIVPEVHVVGDARAPRDVEAAVREGYDVGAAV
jgi:pyruvate/2-oxoglutarate dehydrogenase complex dihydrolipoamide dehydrogenase (E3) component